MHSSTSCPEAKANFGQLCAAVHQSWTRMMLAWAQLNVSAGILQCYMCLAFHARKANAAKSRHWVVAAHDLRPAAATGAWLVWDAGESTEMSESLFFGVVV